MDNDLFYVVDAVANGPVINVPLQPQAQRFQNKLLLCYVESAYIQIDNLFYQEGDIVELAINSAQPYSQDTRNSNNPSVSLYSVPCIGAGNRRISINNTTLDSAVLCTLPSNNLKISVRIEGADSSIIEKLKCRLKFVPVNSNITRISV